MLCVLMELNEICLYVSLVRECGWSALPPAIPGFCYFTALMLSVLAVLWWRTGPHHAVAVDLPADQPALGRMKDPENTPDWEEDV